MFTLAGWLYVMYVPRLLQTFHQQATSLEQEGQHGSSYHSAVPLQGDEGETEHSSGQNISRQLQLKWGTGEWRCEARVGICLGR